MLGLVHGGEVVGLLEFAVDVGLHRGAGDGHVHRLAQLHAQLAQALAGTGVGFRRGRVSVDDQVELAGQVVDHGQLFAQQQLDVGQVQVVRLLRVGELLLDISHRVIAEVAGQAAAKARQAGAQGHLEALLEVGDEVERVAFVGFHHAAIRDHFGAHARGAQQRTGMQADERVASEALAAHHGFEQEGVDPARLRLRQLQV